MRTHSERICNRTAFAVHWQCSLYLSLYPQNAFQGGHVPEKKLIQVGRDVIPKSARAEFNRCGHERPDCPD